MDIASTVIGIPCIVRVTHFSYLKGDSSTWASDIDHHGGYCMEWHVCDRNGRPAQWLQDKVTARDLDRIERQIIDVHQHETY